MNKYNIGLLILSTVLICLLSFNIYNEFQAKDNICVPEESVTTDGQAYSSDSYYLYEVNGYIVVFLSDKKTPYEFTNIRYDELPEIIRMEIQNGKFIKNTEELYGFLENYSS